VEQQQQQRRATAVVVVAAIQLVRLAGNTGNSSSVSKTGEWEWKNEKAELLLVVAEDDGITNVRVWSRRQG
jgi:hypothetical protein